MLSIPFSNSPLGNLYNTGMHEQTQSFIHTPVWNINEFTNASKRITFESAAFLIKVFNPDHDLVDWDSDCISTSISSSLVVTLTIEYTFSIFYSFL